MVLRLFTTDESDVDILFNGPNSKSSFKSLTINIREWSASRFHMVTNKGHCIITQIDGTYFKTFWLKWFSVVYYFGDFSELQVGEMGGVQGKKIKPVIKLWNRNLTHNFE